MIPVNLDMHFLQFWGKKFKNIYLFLAVLGFSCSTQDPLLCFSGLVALWHIGS